MFEPGSRNNWHTHPAGQILLITDGKGFYQERGEPARSLSKGDVIVIPSGVEHWHGATRDSYFSHIAISNITAKGAVEWLTPVTDEEYLRLPYKQLIIEVKHIIPGCIFVYKLHDEIKIPKLIY